MARAFLVVLAVLLAATVLASATSVPFKNCYNGSKGTITALDASPYPVVKGQPLTVTATGTLSESVTGGSASIVVKFLGVQIFQQSVDLCSLSPNLCPIAAGPLNFSQTATVPNIAPSGSYEIILNATDQSGNDLFCADISIQIQSSVEAEEEEEVATILLPAVPEVKTPVPFKSCSSNAKATVNSIDATPYPVVKGQNLTVAVAGSVSEQVTAGQYSLTVKFLGIQIFSTTGDLCTLDPSRPCPIPAGALSLSETAVIPNIAPSGSYEIIINATDQSGNDLLCIDIPVQITAASEAASHRVRLIESDEELDLTAPAINPERIREINSKQTSWVAGVNRIFQGLTIRDIKRLCGAWKEVNPPPVKTELLHLDMAVPDEFDSRAAWPQCNATIGHIRDQGSCGSCWAFGAVEAMSDRLCISTNGSTILSLAAEDPVSCCTFLCGDGCNGGYPSGAWDYFQSTGIVTGGDYDSNQGCYPYQVAACDHHVVGHLPPSGNEGPTPSCTRKCQNNATWSSDKHHGKSSYSVPSDVASIQKEIMTNGPVEAAYTVYEDFVSYKSGVYHHVSGAALGGHAVKILGWGVEDNQPYWLVANSWNSDWGDQGYFKILRGVDECGIEDSIVAGLV